MADNTRRVYVHLTTEEIAELDEIAEQTCGNRAGVIRAMVRQGIRDQRQGAQR